MSDLLDEMDQLDQLSRLRAEVTEFRDSGIKALTSDSYIGPQEHWEDTVDQVEKAVCLRVLFLANKRGFDCGPRANANRQAWLSPGDGVLGVTVQKLFAESPDKKMDIVPLLRAARVMQALLVTPVGPGETAFPAVWSCYYRIMREVFYAGPTEWLVDGVRAGEEAPATAFITGECVRAIQLLARSLEYSRRMFLAVALFRESTDELAAPRFPSSLAPWAKEERERQKLSLEIWLRKSISGALLPTSEFPFDGESSDKKLQLFWAAASRDALDVAYSCRDTLSQIRRFREGERDHPGSAGVRGFHWSESAHCAAVDLLEKGYPFNATTLRALPPGSATSSL